ncbi:MAG: N-acetylmuramoyl-L-alanine amidase [Polyangiales bacterium]
MKALRFLPFVVLLAACSAEAPAQVAVREGPMASSFGAVAAKANVPRDLLIAIAAVEGGLEIPAVRTVDPDATIPVAGPMHLRRGKLDTLKLGAELMHVSEIELRERAELGLEAGAMVLAELGKKTGAKVDDLGSWAAALEELSGYADAPHRTDYAHRVYALLAKGDASIPAREGETIALRPQLVPESLTRIVDLVKIPEVIDETRGADYPGAEWFPTSCSGKCTTDRGGNTVKYVVIHDTEGGWDASVSTLQNDPGKSVHYIIGQDGRLGQFVNETVTAWHAGNFWYNQRSIGIEHVGYYNKPYPEAQYAKSATLLTYLTKKYSVPKDRAHIIGHDQIPNGNVMAESSAPCSDSPKTCETGSNYGGAGNHRDPGDWEWCTYMVRFGGTCKCNDIWELWNCSSDKTKAFRCVSGKVELATCDGPGGCEVMAVGTADVCHQKMPSPPDAGGGDTGDDAGTIVPADTGTTTTIDDTGTAAVDSGAPNADQPTADASSGCGCRTTGSAENTGLAWLSFALGLFAFRRRASSRPR